MSYYSNPEVHKLIKELTDLKESAGVRANTFSSYEYADETEEEQLLRRTKAGSAEDTYAYCIMRLRDLKV